MEASTNQDKRDGQWHQTLNAGFLPKRETLCLTRAANLQKILRRGERERGGGEKREMKEKKEKGWEEKKEGEVPSHENRREGINMAQ